ncbi:MAG: alpha-N-acetylglucosaminidase, partial [Bacteroidales bacterium]|nr:alpha-N-acetylglucosaminidase [Bacteroidales bacterium]
MKRQIVYFFFLIAALPIWAATPIDGLLERIDPGASKKFVIELKRGSQDFFELDQKGKKVVVRGNNFVNIASGINWYLKYYAGVQLTWNQMHAKLPAVLPAVPNRERHETNLSLRYDFNYCTFSYSMPFWGWERWQEEIDWMALHGINMPLAAVGYECVWKNVMEKLGYSRKDIDDFIAGPAFLAWWEMNNLEGWGGPNPDSWYEQQEALQKKIVQRMKELDIHPVLPGYSGMVPSKFMEQSKVEVGNEDNGESSISTVQLWNGFTRPGILMPTDPRFQEFADLFYEESVRLFGKADYYSMDPFHEAKNLPEDLDLKACFRAIYTAMKKANPKATWVCQGWSENPRQEMLDEMKPGEVIFLDLFSECRPMWGAPSIWQKEKGYEGHDWLFCLLENFGANIGLHGRMDQLIDNFYMTKNHPLAKQLKGMGLTMEGSETNPIMYELMCELPWRDQKFTKEEWVKNYVRARYGLNVHPNPEAEAVVLQAWDILAQGIYNCPPTNNQQGPHESIFCSRPSLDCFQASSWSKMQNYYDPTTTAEAAKLLSSVAHLFKGNNNFEYDLVDVIRQSLADKARIVYNQTVADFKSFDKKRFAIDSQEFLKLLLLQDKLLNTRSEFKVGRWIEMARQKGLTLEEKDHYEWNARVQIT